ncbi:CDP-glycerol glycerophosphotransferase family protein [Cohnella thermotolerans]|uniref:CDP-glycerol glycerophosphotransferase family protein n=1 Tax=Cohnella thermotolerans TaxID=329858 RepID=UPI0004009F4F|nr:CDP-glycerol glycerophosphotransferase family protein [Cohnella thermotolerans]
MRLQRKLQLLELTDTLKEALQFLGTPAAAGANFLQDDCLVCVSQIASALKDEENRHYAELLCEACEDDIRSGQFEAACRTADLLSKWIQEHVQVQYEIVFMPYKAEMWDALDSVWRAAKADPRCVVRTVPIPYQSLGPQLESLTDEYDGDRFPSYVEITHYNDYDLGLHRPDVIFIHNPYDAYNRVTRVHPRYFSSNLIQYTDKLVYIPYFMSLGRLNPSLPRLPSASNSWRIFVESEFIRREYLANEELDPNRVVALGSPKLDYLHAKMQAGASMPPEWEEALQGRTVFFYNSTLSRLLGDDDVVKDMQEVFRFFAGRPDLAVIWRPHPLSVQTLKSTRPHLLESYLSLVEEFKRIPNAVYDESEEMHGAILHSDAYIGDYSSVLIPYVVTGKPILKLYPNVMACLNDLGAGPAWLDYRDEPYIPLAVGPGTIHDGVLLFPALNRGRLFALDLGTEQITEAPGFPADRYVYARLFALSCVYGDNVWLIPDRAAAVMKYNRQTGEISEHPLPSNRSQVERRFAVAVQHGRHAWLLPAQYDRIVRLDLETGEMKAYKFKLANFSQGGHSMCADGVVFHNELWIALPERQTIVQMNLATGDMKAHKPNFLREPIRAIVTDGAALWLVLDTAIAQWNPYTKETRMHCDWPEGFAGGDQPFCGAAFDGEYVWLVPHDANMIVKIAVETGEVSAVCTRLEKSEWAMINDRYRFDTLERNRGLEADHALFSAAILDGEWIWFCPVTAPDLLGIHRRSGEVRRVPVRISRIEDEKTILSDCFPNPPEDSVDLRSTFSHPALPLSQFVDMVCKGDLGAWAERQREQARACFVHADGTSGRKIWEYVAGHLN